MTLWRKDTHTYTASNKRNGTVEERVKGDRDEGEGKVEGEGREREGTHIFDGQDVVSQLSKLELVSHKNYSASFQKSRHHSVRGGGGGGRETAVPHTEWDTKS